jgi:hypothetical protein
MKLFLPTSRAPRQWTAPLRGAADFARFHLCLSRHVRTPLPVVVRAEAPVRSAAAVKVAKQKNTGTLFQYSTLPALSLGLYDGNLTFAQLLRHGDFGLGTLNALDGEVIVLDGRAWQMRSEGRVLPITPQRLTPFAVVTHFAPGRTWKLAAALRVLEVENAPHTVAADPQCAVRDSHSRHVSRLKVRSVPRQAKALIHLYRKW